MRAGRAVPALRGARHPIEYSAMSVLEQVRPHLLRVKQPAQYMGGEVNAVRKEWQGRVRFGLCFPDAYTIGMSNQGFKILYHLLNETHDDLLCERAFAPWFDMEAVLRQNAIPLYSLENYRPLREFDVLGFSLQNETSYTNLLNMLDLAGIPLRSADRDVGVPPAPSDVGVPPAPSDAGVPPEPSDAGVPPALECGPEAHITDAGQRPTPLVIAGGTGSITPEPLADFIDAFLLGEGEEVLPAFLHLVGVWRGRLEPAVLEQYRPREIASKDVLARRPFTLRFAWLPDDLAAIKGMARRDFLALCAGAIPGCYVPALYDVEYNTDGTIAAFKPNVPGLPVRIKKNTLDNLNTAYYPTKQIIPFVEVVQDRVTIEIMRGCTEGCRYCQAGMIDRPQRYRTPEKVVELARALVANTGYDEISLLSLSSSDHPQLVPMIKLLQEEFAGKYVSVALPSLRVDQQLTYLPGLTKNVRKSGLTMAPESGSERMRRVINKTITQHDLREGARAALAEGYKTIKFYMLIGMPTENEHDMHESAALLNEIGDMARAMKRRDFTLNVTVSLFVPKAFTPFQWEPMTDRETLERHGKLLRSMVRHKNIRVKLHDYGTSRLEALYSRGDRKLGRLTEIAWQKGARFDAWDECCNPELWQQACIEAGIDPDFYIHRQRTENEILPWDHISVGTSKRHLWEERVRSRLEQYTQDCSGHTPGCLACGVDPLTCRTGLEQPSDEMTPQMQRRKGVKYADSFKPRLAQKAELAAASSKFFG